jgi:trk system potassium uptake protein
MRVIIVGAGAVGYYLAARLSEEAQEVVLVDPDPERIQRATDNLDVLAVRGNGADLGVLEEAGIGRADLLMAVSGVDEVNLLACFAASRAGVKVRVARVRNPDQFREGSAVTPRDLGVDLLISPEQECAWEIFQLLSTPAATDLARFAGGRVQLVGMPLLQGAPLLGRPLAELDRDLGDHRFVLAAVVRKGRTEMPTGATVLEAGDKIFLLAPAEDLPLLPPLAGYRSSRLRRVMIAGGSDEAVHLAGHLGRQGVSCTILELDRTRARELAELLPGALVLNGDATDLNLLEMEGVEGVDGFVALTDRDEINMLISLLARNLGAHRVIPLVHRTEYMALLDGLGLGAAVSPRFSAANAILRYIRKGPVASVATMKGSRAEAMEVVIGESARLSGRAVRDIDFPPGAVLGALVRNDEVIMPRGGTVVHPGDRAIFFVLPEATEAVGRLIR